MLSINTKQTPNNGQLGVMFNIKARTDIVIKKIWSSFGVASSKTVGIYSRTGGYYKGSTGWKLLEETTFTPSEINTPVEIPIDLSIEVRSGTTIGVMVLVLDGTGIRYVSESSNYSNSDLIVSGGVGVGNTSISSFFDGRMLSGRVYYELGTANNPPQKIGAFINQPIEGSRYLSEESASVSWEPAVDLDGDSLTYTLELFNGSSWNVIEQNLVEPTFEVKLTSLDSIGCQFRVKARDAKGAESDYLTSNTFTVRKNLLLIQDGDIIKTYKNGEWQTI